MKTYDHEPATCTVADKTMTHRTGTRAARLRRGLSLEEREKLLREYPVKRLSARKVADAKRTISRWRQTKPFDDAGTFAAYLSMSWLDERAMRTAICFPVTKEVRARDDLTHLAKKLDFLCASRIPLPESNVGPDGHSRLLSLIYPLIAANVQEILEALPPPSTAKAVIAPGVVRKQAEADLCRELILLLHKTCLWELKIAKLRGGLSGGTTRERYNAFIAQLATPKFRRQVFEQYPVLLQSVCKHLEMYRDNTLRMLSRLNTDATTIATTFFHSPALASLESWAFGAGDSHCGGQTVVGLRFADDSRVMYKPRSLGADMGFAELVTWCNEKLPGSNLRTAKVIDRDTYGWSEYIPHAEAQLQGDVAAFYRKQGVFLALFYGLHASDMHHENVICNGSDPVYVDFETLFHPQLPGRTHDSGHASREWPITVASTQVIEARQDPGAEGTMPDLSALGAKDGQRYPGHAFKVVDAGTDTARLEEEAFDWQVGGNHLPKIGGTCASAGGYVAEIISGFKETYDLLRAEKEFLASPDGISKWFSGSRTRVIPRPTELYSTLVQRSFHPDVMSDAAERRCFLARILSGSCDAGSVWMDRFVRHEIEDMENLDVPVFFQDFDSQVIRSSKGVALDVGALPSPRDRAIQHINDLSASDRNAQVRLVASVLRAPQRTLQPGADSRAQEEFFASIAEGRLIDAARGIADPLLSEVIERGADRYWMCKAVTSSGSRFSTNAVGLYDGMLGIILFLGAASKVTGYQPYADVALSALDTVRRWTGDGAYGFANLGLFGGVYGLPYVIACLSKLTVRADLGRDAVAMAMAIDPEEHVDDLDVFNGTAGIILFLNSLRDDPATSAKDRGAIEARIERLADTLLATCAKQTIGVGWVAKHRGASKVPLTGFAHGNAGIAAALYTAARALDDPKYRMLANAAIAYEDAHRNSAGDNWLDLREPTSTSHIGKGHHGEMCALCHGSAGILLGRLIGLDGFDEDEQAFSVLRRDAVTAFRTTWNRIERGEMGNVSICHGLLGNLEIMQDAIECPYVEAPDVPMLSLSDESITWRCGDDVGSPVTSPTSDPGFMIGRAGVGYALLRHAAPALVPSVIRLEHIAKPNRYVGQDTSAAWLALERRLTSNVGVGL